MISPSVKLLAWSAWGPGLAGQTEMTDWLMEGRQPEEGPSQPPCQGIDRRLRRRFSQTTKMALETGLDACRQANVAPHETHLLYGSINGEITILSSLLKDLAEKEPLSPTAFSNSVHHVPTGYYGLTTQHKGVSRTLSALEDTFACLWLDMLGLLKRNASLPVLLIVAEEMPPEPFLQMVPVPPFPYSVALLLEPAADDLPGSMRCQAMDPAGKPSETRFRDQPFTWLRWFLSDEPCLRLRTKFGGLEWHR